MGNTDTVLFETISKRKSTRRYAASALDDDVLEKIKTFVNSIKPLYNDIEFRFDILPTGKLKGITNAPYFLEAYSEKKDGSQTNIGFMLQQADLYIQSIGLGSCWMGMQRSIESGKEKLEFVILLAFGKAQGPVYRELSAFKRKPLEKISDTADKRLEPARLAPSAINSQPWFFVSSDEGFDCYCAKKFPAMIYENINKIDMGIALAHLFVSYPDKFEFYIKNNPKPVKGHYYTGSIRI